MRNKGFCCENLGKGTENTTIRSRRLKKGHQNCLEMKSKIFRGVYVKEVMKETFLSKCAAMRFS